MKADWIDVLIVAEGTYPYIRGGVSSWIHQLIRNMEDMTFGILFLGSRREDYGDIRYELPKNVKFFKEFFLFSESGRISGGTKRGKKEVFYISSLLKDTEALPEKLWDHRFYLAELSIEDFLRGRYTWDLFEEIYLEQYVDLPFVEFFWALRNLLTPLWMSAKAIEELGNLKVGVIHAPSTGYAGFVGGMLKKKLNASFIITEHGIYTKERKIDILKTFSSKSLTQFMKGTGRDLTVIQRLWIKFFENLGKIAYTSADAVFSLHAGAREIQISLGCPQEKAYIIPNGVDLKSYSSLRKEKPEKRIALIGRVTPIKDIKTFIKAMKILLEDMPEVEGWIVGPEEEDPEYAQECKEMVRSLGIDGRVKFLGFKRLNEILPEIGITTLTSISEGMPIVILESLAAGVPCVTTDVGSCRQLIYGGIDEEDLLIGKAGEIVKVGDYKELAYAYKKILENPDLWKDYGNNGMKRIEKYYTLERMIKAYREVYLELLGERKWQAYQLN